MSYVLGVDAGATKTVALIARTDGTIAGYGRDAGSDIYNAASVDAALAPLDAAVDAALRGARIGTDGLLAGCFSMTGADWPEDFVLLRAEVARRGLGTVQVVVNDAMGALRAGSPDGDGVVVNCGTGAAIGARGPDGREWHTSHWQGVGGSLYLGQRTLTAVYRAELGIDGPTRLTAAVLALFERQRVEDVLHLVTARGAGRPAQLGRLARVLLDEAERGDTTARRTVEDHGMALGDYALVAARRVGLAGRSFPLVLTGGVLRHPGRLLRDALTVRVRAHAPGACPIAARFEPAVGALLLALEAADIGIDEALLERLTSTLPPSALFAT